MGVVLLVLTAMNVQGMSPGRRGSAAESREQQRELDERAAFLVRCVPAVDRALATVRADLDAPRRVVGLGAVGRRDPRQRRADRPADGRRPANLEAFYYEAWRALRSAWSCARPVGGMASERCDDFDAATGTVKIKSRRRRPVSRRHAHRSVVHATCAQRSRSRRRAQHRRRERARHPLRRSQSGRRTYASGSAPRATRAKGDVRGAPDGVRRIEAVASLQRAVSTSRKSRALPVHRRGLRRDASRWSPSSATSAPPARPTRRARWCGASARCRPAADQPAAPVHDRRRRMRWRHRRGGDRLHRLTSTPPASRA